MPPSHDPHHDAAVLAWADAAHGRAPGPEQEQEAAAAASTELRALLLALGCPLEGSRPERPSFVEGQPIRAGYRLVAQLGMQPDIAPVFAEALAADLPRAELSRLFDHLWGVDLELWRMLEDASPAELARRWLISPGRRLVQDLGVLARMREDLDHLDATDLRLAALWAASGAELEPASPPPSTRWCDLHRSIPGEAMSRWQPKQDERAFTIALTRLERGSPHGLRGAALAWLLNRAVDQRQVEVDGIHQDLRTTLPTHLAIALARDDSDDFSSQLEAQLLQHAAWIATRDTGPGKVRRAWHLARWLHGCLVRSPFAPGSEEGLHAEVTALLPTERAPIVPDDPLHPARFGGHEGMSVEDLALVAGAWAHYDRKGEHLEPAPLPLKNAMLRLADRLSTQGELEAERSLARGESNELGWTAPHVAPPWLARWLLTQWHATWLANRQPAVIEECITRLAHDARVHWLAHVIRIEGPLLDESAKTSAHAAWSHLIGSGTMAAEQLASLGIGLLRRLDAAERRVAFGCIERAPASWQPYLYDAWAERALLDADLDLARPALERLLALAERAQPAKVQLDAALLLLRRAPPIRPKAEGMALLRRLGTLAQEPPLRDHQPLLRELRRLGAMSPPAS
jgi:hypothetical protein